MKAFVALCCLLALISAVPAFCETFEDSKNYYTPSPPDPSAGTPPVYGSPPPYRTSPSHGSSPPHHHHNPTPSPPLNCGNPPPYHVPTPTTPSPSPPSGSSGGSYNPSPSPPSGSSGGSYNPPYSGGTPPTPAGGNPPTTPIIPGTPLVPVTPTTPTIGTPPTVGSPPYVFDPNNPFPGTCDFWRNHPTLIWGLVGWVGTLGSSMGVPSVPGFPANTNLLQALSNTRVDGYGNLYREGSASLLNSLASNRFPFSATQVRDSFIASLGSNQAAQAQARVFRLANEGHYRPRA